MGPTMLTISKAAELTGVPAHTLRAWERRYGLAPTSRTPGGYRVYDPATLDRVRVMAALVADGWAPRDAAAEVRRRGADPGSTRTPPRDPHLELTRAAAALDAELVTRILDEQFALGDFETVVGQWLMPALDRIGREWATGRLSVAGEHLVANAVLRRLSAAYEAAGARPGRPVVVGAPPGALHELGLLAFAVACRRTGLPTLYLGAEVPLDAWVEAVGTAGARAVVTSVPRRRDVAHVRQVVDLLHTSHPKVPVWVGGRHQHLVGAPAHPLGHDIGEAARLLARTPHDAQEDPWTTT